MPGRAIAVGVTLAAVLVTPSLGHAQVVRQITDARTGRTSVGDMDDAGSVVYAISSTDPVGTNPRHLFQIFRWDTVTGVAEQITDFADGVVLDYFGDMPHFPVLRHVPFSWTLCYTTTAAA